MYYATVKHHSIVGYWERINATTLTGAKRVATKEMGDGYHGHVIHLIACNQNDVDCGRLNDIPAHTKVISSGNNAWVAP